VFGKVKIGIENIKELSVTVCGGTLPDILEQGLVLHYSFEKDQGGKVMDESGRRNNGTVHGAKWERLGSGGMYDFQGSPAKGDYIEVPNSESLVSMEKTRQLTLALWIKPRTVRSYFPELICKGGNQPPDAYDGYELILEGSSTHDIFFVSGPFDILTFNARGRWVNQHLNEWIHIVFAVDASSDKAVCYVNGRPTNDLRTGAGAAPSFKGIKFDRPNNLYIGRADPRHHTNRGYFDGMIGEVEIYNRTLSPEDVCLLYSKGIAKYSLK